MNEIKERRRGVSISLKQKEVMIEFLKRNPKVISGKFTKEFTMNHGRLIWQELTRILNGIPGATNGWKKWRKVWHDLHTKIKKKRRLLLCSDQVLAMNGLTKPTELTELECEILQISLKEDDVSFQHSDPNFIDMNGFAPSEVGNDEIIIIKHSQDGFGSPDEDEHNPLDDISSEESPADYKEKLVQINNNEFDSKKTRKKNKFIDSLTSGKMSYLRRKLVLKQKYYDKKLILLEKEIIIKESMLNILSDINMKLTK